MKDKIIRLIFIIFGIGWLIFIFFGLLYEYVLKKEPDWNKVGQKNIGQVYKISGGGGGGSGAWIEHYLDGNRYASFDGLNFWGMVLGDRFNILYDPSNPEKFKVIRWQPVFTEEEETVQSTGKLISVTKDSWMFLGAIKFTYQVGKEIYKRQQFLNPNLENYEAMEIGNKYIIRYWVVDPQRAIIYLDKPIKE